MTKDFSVTQKQKNKNLRQKMFDLKQKWTIIKIRKQKLRFGGKHMKIAVTHENGTVFQHFGHTESFKIYEVIDTLIKHSNK